MITTPRPLDGQVHLYGLVLPHDASELARLGGFLSSNETIRADLLKSGQVARRYIVGRGLLREILAGYLGIKANQVQLAAGEYGKPFLMDNQAGLCFNLAHSGDNFLLAIAGKCEVGIDIEMIAPGKPLEDMARVVFSRRELASWSRLPAPDREAAFYRCWVRKEACLKACGSGFSLPESGFEISLLDETPAVMMAFCHQKHWQVVDIDGPARYCAALAIESSGSTRPPPNVVRVKHRLSFNQAYS
jgi:4'-phosphopantetheinyl transferase